MALINPRAGPVDVTGLYMLADALNRLIDRRDATKRREALGKAGASLFEGPRAAEREAQGLPRLGPKAQGYAKLFADAPEELFELGVARQKGIRQRKGEREKFTAQERKERSARVERETAAIAASRRSIEGQKEVAAYRAALKGGERKGPTATQLNQRARGAEIGQILAPLAATDPAIATMLDLGKAVRRGEDRLPEYRAAVETALGPKLRRRAELQMKAKGLMLEPGEDQELLDLDRIDEAMLRDALRYGEAAGARRAGRQGVGVGATGVSRPPRESLGETRAVSPSQGIGVQTSTDATLNQGIRVAQPGALSEKAPQAPDRFDAILEDVGVSGVDPMRILDGLERGDPAMLAALGIDERDAPAVAQRLGDALMGGQEPAVQEEARMTRETPRTKLGATFGMGVGGTNMLRNLAGEVGSRVRMPGGGNLAETLGIVPRGTDPGEERALGEITAQAVRQGLSGVGPAIGRAASATAAPFVRGARETAAQLPGSGEAAMEGALGIAAIPPQMGVSLFDALNRTAAMEPALAAVPGQAQSSMARALGPAERQAAQIERAISDLFAQPEQAMQAEPGRNIFGQEAPMQGPAMPPSNLMPDELAEIQQFLIDQEKRRRIEKLLAILSAVPGG